MTSTPVVRQIVPFTTTAVVLCANGGAGEFIAVSGELLTWRTTTVDGDGGFHYVTHVQPVRTSGVGLTTGDRYRETGAFQTVFNAKAGSTTTAVRLFQLVGPGPGNNLLLYENLHLTVDATGSVTAAVDNLKTECK